MGLGALFGGRSGLDEAADQVALDFAHCGDRGGGCIHERCAVDVGCGGDDDVVSTAQRLLGLPDPHRCLGRNVPALVTSTSLNTLAY